MEKLSTKVREYLKMQKSVTDIISLITVRQMEKPTEIVIE